MAQIISPERVSRAGGPGASYRLAGKIINQPLAMHLAAAQQLKAAIDARAFDGDLQLSLGSDASKFVGTKDQSSRYRVTDCGIAIVPVQGVLLDRGEWLGDLGGYMTSYEGLAEQFRRVAKDDAIKCVLLDIDSPGGMAVGLLDVVAELGKLKKQKKVTAVAANMAASAAYAIGCAAHELYVTGLGIAGSIGVVSMHASYARALDQGGVDVTIVHAGDRKADGNPYQSLSAGARAEMSAFVDQIYGQFVSHVAKARGMDEQAVRATQARCYAGDEAVRAGLADGVKSFEDVLDHIRGGSSKGARGKTSTKGRTMSNDAAVAVRPDYDQIIAVSLAAIAAGSKPAAAAPVAPAAAAPVVAPATDTRARVKAILSGACAKDRPALAQHLALETDIAPEQAEAILAAAPVEAAAAAAAVNPLAAAMKVAGNSAGVRPESAGATAPPSLASVFKARLDKSKR